MLKIGLCKEKIKKERKKKETTDAIYIMSASVTQGGHNKTYRQLL